MVLSQEVSVSLSIIALVALIGAGVGVGSGIGARSPPRGSRVACMRQQWMHALREGPVCR